MFTFDDVILLNTQISKLEKQLEEVKKHLLPLVIDAGGTLQYNGFSFRAGKKVTYAFTDQVTQAAKSLAQLKKQEISDGFAQVRQTTQFLAIRELRKSKDGSR